MVDAVLLAVNAYSSARLGTETPYQAIFRSIEPTCVRFALFQGTHAVGLFVFSYNPETTYQTRLESVDAPGAAMPFSGIESEFHVLLDIALARMETQIGERAGTSD